MCWVCRLLPGGLFFLGLEALRALGVSRLSAAKERRDHGRRAAASDWRGLRVYPRSRTPPGPHDI